MNEDLRQVVAKITERVGPEAFAAVLTAIVVVAGALIVMLLVATGQG